MKGGKILCQDLSNITKVGKPQILIDKEWYEWRSFTDPFECVYVCGFVLRSVLDLNAFERQNKAEGLGMAMDESSGTVFIWK